MALLAKELLWRDLLLANSVGRMLGSSIWACIMVSMCCGWCFSLPPTVAMSTRCPWRHDKGLDFYDHGTRCMVIKFGMLFDSKIHQHI